MKEKDNSKIPIEILDKGFYELVADTSTTASMYAKSPDTIIIDIDKSKISRFHTNASIKEKLTGAFALIGESFYIIQSISLGVSPFHNKQNFSIIVKPYIK